MKNITLSQNILIALFVTLLTACSSDKATDNSKRIRPVKTYCVTEADSIYNLQISGTVKSDSDSYPAFKTPGTISKVYIKEGDVVEEGQLLAELDNKTFKETYAAAEAKYNQVSAEVNRVIKLYEKGSVAKNEYEKAISGLQSVTSLYEVSKNNLEGSRLLSPISGIVQEVMLGSGQMATPASAVVNILGDKGLSIEAFISAATYLKNKNIKQCYASSSIIKEEIPIDISFISEKANNNQLHKIKFSIPTEQKDKLALGMVLSINMTIEKENKNMGELIIPISSCFIENNKTYVWRVCEKNRIEKQIVKTKNISERGKIIVTEGVSVGETIVSAGVLQLNEGDKIRILNSNK